MDTRHFNAASLRRNFPIFFAIVGKATDMTDLRTRLSELALQLEIDAAQGEDNQDAGSLARIRDCAKMLRNILRERSDTLAGFSAAQAIADIAAARPRPDLTAAFFAELHHILWGLQGRGPRKALDDIHLARIDHLSGREAAMHRSDQLDQLRLAVDQRIARFPSGLSDESIIRRQEHSVRILKFLGGTSRDWHNWRWQINHIIREPETLSRLIDLTDDQHQAVFLARQHRLPFGITPYYLSLMDRQPSARDAAIRAQVLPSVDYVTKVEATKNSSCLDFMGEEDTSPCELITRRYPAICILKPFNSCPQICVYCQRNWEIEDAMAKNAYAGKEKINQALDWIRQHPAIHEVLVTGGDPLAMGDAALEHILSGLAGIDTVERIRIGTRTLVTMPMRVTQRLVAMLGKYRRPGWREVALITHVQHPYEITPEVMLATDLLRRRGIPVYNQLVYTFYGSRRFEASALRRHLRLIGIDPYYTFNTKGKEETRSFRVPIARLIQEQQEESRMLPGLERTDEAVFNVPRQGKNYLKSREHRDLLSILPNGVRVYEFHPWERSISQSTQVYVYQDMPILDYLERLELAGEDLSEYETIWYYY